MRAVPPLDQLRRDPGGLHGGGEFDQPLRESSWLSSMENVHLAPNAQVSLLSRGGHPDKMPLAVRHIHTFLRAHRPVAAARAPRQPPLSSCRHRPTEPRTHDRCLWLIQVVWLPRGDAVIGARAGAGTLNGPANFTTDSRPDPALTGQGLNSHETEGSRLGR
jgi:hypothetical protein